MKKILCLLLAAVILGGMAILSSCGGGESYAKLKESLEGEYSSELAGTEINVFNWGEYISDGSDGTLDINAAFEAVTGIKVNYTTFESNEQMYAKLKSGAVSYDIIIPSDYMIERLKNENMLKKIDVKSLSNYKYIADEYKGLYFDENEEYSAPYNVGMVGLIYNKTMVDEPIDSWNVMWDEKYKDNILSFSNPRDAFMIAQMLLGQSLNTTDKAQWDKAAQKLIEQKTVLQGRVMDEVFNKMESGNAAIAAYYAGDCLTMIEENPDLAFVYPKEGTNIFVDSVCVPSSSKNTDAAMLYMNFLMEPQIALATAEYLCYASPNTAVINNEEYSYFGSEILYPAKDKYPKVEYYHDLDKETRDYYERLWETVFTAN